MTEKYGKLVQDLGNSASLCTRWTAARELGRLGDARAVKPLTTALGDEDSDMRKAAAEALGQLGDARAVKPLTTALGDEDSAVRKAAAEALDRLGWKPEANATGAAYWIAKQDWDQCLAIGNLAMDSLIAALEDKSRQMRSAAAETLGKSGDARAVKPLTTALGDEDSDMRKAAVEALGRLGDARAVKPLTTALGDEDSAMRKAAAEALDRLSWKPEANATGVAYWIAKQDWDQCLAIGNLAMDSLIAALEDKSRQVRSAAAETLGKSGDARAVKPLIAALGDEASAVRKAAMEALGRLGDARAVRPLVATLRDIHSNVRNTSAKVLDELKWKPQTVDQEVHYWIAKEDWYKCADIGEPAIKPLLDLISLITPITLPYGAGDSIRHVLAERFGSYPSVIEALRKRWVILYADDERDIRELVGFTLRFAGFDVVLVADGIEAIEKAPLQQPDLILLDVRMPKITGYEVCRQLKQNPATCAIPIVFLSAKGQEGEIKQGLASGAVEYIVKPIVPDDLTNQIIDVLRRGELGIYEED